MATLTLRGVKGSPLTHVELDANFTALDSDFRAGLFDSGLEISGGINLNEGDLHIGNGNLVLETGDIHYNPKLGFHDLQSGTETMRLDSSGSLLLGSKVNSQDVNLKVARTGDQHILVGCRSSVVDQTAFLQMGPAADGTEKSGGLRATQTTANFEDWRIGLVSYDGTDYVEAISINPNGSIDVNSEITFHDSAHFNKGIFVDGDIELTGEIVLPGGGSIASGTVESVALDVPTGFEVLNSPITSVGTFVIEYATGYSLPTDASQSNWDTAYGWGDHSVEGYLTSAQFETLFDGAFDSAFGSAGGVTSSRTISTGNGLTGGGDLSADRTLTMDGTYTGDFTVTGTINASGDVVAFYNASDERLKENITIIDNALDKVSTLKGVQFNYIASGIQSTGLIAQDLERVLPEAIFEDEDGHKGIRYQITVGLLVEAIKELKAEIEELKKAK